MRILHLISSSGLFGAERVMLVLCKALTKKSFHPIVGVIKNKKNPHTEIGDEAESSGLSTVIFPCNGQFDLKLIFKIRKFIKKHKIDIVHSHGYKSNLFGLLASYRMVSTITTNHNWLTNHWRLKIYCLLDSIWMRKFDQIVAVSEKIKEEMLNKKIPGNKISVIDNGIDLDRFQEISSADSIKKEFAIAEEDIVIGSIGNLGYEKGQVYLLQAAKEIIAKNDKVKFLIVGDGILRKELENKAIEYGLTNHIIFTGIRKDIPQLLSLMNIFVLPSIREGLPMVLLEALASRTPVIATKVGAVPKLISNNLTGILIDPGDISAIALAIDALIKNADKAKRLAENGYKRVEKEFSSEAMCDRYIKLYN